MSLIIAYNAKSIANRGSGHRASKQYGMWLCRRKFCCLFQPLIDKMSLETSYVAQASERPPQSYLQSVDLYSHPYPSCQVVLEAETSLMRADWGQSIPVKGQCGRATRFFPREPN
ncbi:hypothetical protein RSOLAG1IB_06945 [Rhizoctonia solani AG-1 IB]|uniref:Uncharacterized protein n=1 Tax=Thanatephorus cucumeris (strain AG1-IB / isolate 7/3/14) TaxID=1108050 RepID=A0A0B7FDJ2_THACB|nr:hypothetical protein RSOLAG1IB_06945 [Rhizoctonia solani AG-1 IB]